MDKYIYDENNGLVSYEFYVTKKMSINLEIIFCKKTIEINF